MFRIAKSGICIPAHHAVSRRGFLSTGAIRAAGTVTVAGCFASDMGQIHALRSEEVASELRKQDKRVILLWLAGGASQFDVLNDLFSDSKTAESCRNRNGAGQGAIEEI